MNESIQSPSPVTDPADKGLRSATGIRWLLLAGAMVTGVSIYRLVQSQWAAIPVPLQFLILVGGALGLFGLGAVTRRRLHLPYAGSALLFLFTGLVPVLGWGAAYLRLLDTPWGWLAFSAGGAALLGAAARVLRSELRYRGRIYPAVLGILFASQPVLPWLGERWNGNPNALYALAALVLGALLHIGSLHINRFFFHRDRQDNQERPVHIVPFLLLGILYGGALSLLAPTSGFMALPLAVLGIVLATTGEEYYRALTRSLGEPPVSWPGRSVTLLALGLCLTVASVPLSLMDDTGYCLPLVSLCAAGLFLKWGLTYSHRSAHVTGVLAAFIGYQSLLVFAPDLPSIDRIELMGYWGLGFLALLIGFGILLERLPALEALRKPHAVLIAAQVLWITALGFYGLFLIVPMAVTVGMVLLSLPLVRRIEPVAAVQFTFATLLLATAAEVPGIGELTALLVAGLGLLALVLAGRFLELALARCTRTSPQAAKRALLGPAVTMVPVLLLLTLVMIMLYEELPDLAGANLLAAGAVWVISGYRSRLSFFFLAGGLLASFGAHFELAIRMDGINHWTALVTQVFFVLSWLAVRQSRHEGRLDPTFHFGAQALTLLHGVVALVWLGMTNLTEGATIEPLILLLAGLALLHDGFADRQHESIDLGLALTLLWLPAQIFFAGWLPVWSTALIASLTIAGLEIAVLVLLVRRVPSRWMARRYGLETDDWNVLATLSLRGVTKVWIVLAAAACVLFAGPDALFLALTLVGVEFVTRTEIDGWARRIAFPVRLALLPMLQIAVLAASGGDPGRDLPPALLSLHLSLLPWIALFGLAWRLLVDALGRTKRLWPWRFGVETLIAFGYLVAFTMEIHLPHAFDFTFWADASLIVLATGWAVGSFLDGRRNPDPGYGWLMQIWGGLAVLHAFTAGWLHFGSGVAPYILLAAGAAQYVLGVLFERQGLGKAFAPSCRRVGLALPLIAGVLALRRMSVVDAVWFPALAAFLVSLFYMVVASRESRRTFPAIASAAFLGFALLKVVTVNQLGVEFCFLAPGFALLALAWMLRVELGPVWSRHVTAAGASFVYATPIVALSDQISWGWLAALLVCTVTFGAASFALRSRSLLTVSTAAMLTDLGFFVFRIGTTAPMALWVIGLVFGLALMAGAAYLEYQREGVLQQLRVFGRELQAWN